MTQWIDPLSPGSQLAINRLHQQGEGRRQRATARGIASSRNRTAMALGQQRSQDYAALREMRERMQMRDLDAKEVASQRILAQMERKQQMQRDFLKYFVASDSKMLDEIQGVSAQLDKANMAFLKAQILSGRDKQQWGRIADQLRKLHGESLPIKELEGAIQGAGTDAVNRFNLALPGLLTGGQRPKVYADVVGGSRFLPAQMAEAQIPQAIGDFYTAGWLPSTWDWLTTPAEKVGQHVRGYHNAMFAADGMARRILQNYERDPKLQHRFGPNIGKAQDALTSLYFSLLGSRPDGKSEDYLSTNLPSMASKHYGVNTYGELLNKSLKELQDDLGVPLQEVKLLLEAPARGLENATGQRTYQDFVAFHGGNEKKANKELAKLFSAGASKEERENLARAFEKLNVAEVYQNIADMPILAQAAGVPEAPSTEMLEELVEWMDTMIREGGPLAGMQAAPAKFSPDALQYGEELLGQLQGNIPPDYGRGVAESQLDVLGAIRGLEGQLGRLQERRASLPAWAMGRILE